MIAAEKHSTPQQRARKHVYVINSSPDFLDIVRELLQDEHYNVTTTNFMPSSCQAIAAAQPNVLIIDLVYGDRVSWDLMAKLPQQATTRYIPVLVMSTTASLLDDAKARHEAVGGDRYLTKPCNLDDLLGTIQHMIGTA